MYKPAATCLGAASGAGRPHTMRLPVPGWPQPAHALRPAGRVGRRVLAHLAQEVGRDALAVVAMSAAQASAVSDDTVDQARAPTALKKR